MLSRIILSSLNNEEQINFKYLGKKNSIRRVAFKRGAVSRGAYVINIFQNCGRMG